MLERIISTDVKFDDLFSSDPQKFYEDNLTTVARVDELATAMKMKIKN